MFFRIYRDSVAKQALEYEAGNVRCSQSVLVKRWLLIVFFVSFFQISLIILRVFIANFFFFRLYKNYFAKLFSWDFNRTILPSILHSITLSEWLWTISCVILFPWIVLNKTLCLTEILQDETQSLTERFCPAILLEAL